MTTAKTTILTTGGATPDGPRDAPWSLVIALPLALACEPELEGPRFPDDGDHDAGDTGECFECHLDGDGESMPDDHEEGSEPTSDHEDCLECHESD